MADMEIWVFVAEPHGDHLTPMFPAPRIDMCILQQVVAHLTLISGEYHRFSSVNA